MFKHSLCFGVYILSGLCFAQENDILQSSASPFFTETDYDTIPTSPFTPEIEYETTIGSELSIISQPQSGPATQIIQLTPTSTQKGGHETLDSEDYTNTISEPDVKNVTVDQDEKKGGKPTTNATPLALKTTDVYIMDLLDLKSQETLCVVSLILNSSNLSWYGQSGFQEALVETLKNNLENIEISAIIFVSPIFKSSEGQQVQFFISMSNITAENGSFCYPSKYLVEILREKANEMEREGNFNILAMHPGVMDNVNALVHSPLTISTLIHPAVFAVSAIVLIFFIIGLLIFCSLYSSKKQRFKEVPYPVEPGKNLASDKECTASEYVINVLDADLSRSISDERDEECTWVVPIEEVCSTKNHDNFEDTKL
ncbi:uncharacterized protein LOC136032701 [Artemia franciscana]|uniref:Uncharacterized protein n=1 Tax=Artemia franciscana TaxID=6661 RepID=A0AA88IMI7_ARTSF|nr:hypothetical protein QYM36_001110 [Artemia franciscana]